MKTTMIKYNGERMTVSVYRVCMMVMVLAMLSGVAQASPPSYQNTDQPMYQQAGLSSPTTATMPSASFQSTSSYSGQWNQNNQQSTLNADGTVNEDAYGVGAKRPGMRKSGNGSGYNPGTPDDGEEEEGEWQPIGDGLWLLIALALAYAGTRVYRARRMREV